MNKPSSSQQTHSSYNGNMNNAHFKSQSQSSQSSSRAPSAPPMFKPKDIVPCNDTLLQCLDNINNIILNGASININHSFLKGFYSYLCIAVFSICEPKSKNNRGYVTSICIDYSANGATWIYHNITDGEYKLEYSQLDTNIFGDGYSCGNGLKVTGYGGAALIQLHLIKLQKKMIDNDYILGN